MNKNLKIIIAFAILIVGSIILSVFKVVPATKIWKEYKVVYISTQYDSKTISTLFLENGIDGFISSFTQKSINRSPYSPVHPDFSFDGFNSETIREFFFLDKSQKYSLYYIPNDEFKKVSSVLEKNQIEYGTDSSTVYPWICPIICILVAIVLFILSKINILRFCSVIPLLFYVFCVPFYTSAMAVCTIIFVMFIAELLWKRKHALNSMLHNVVIISFAVIALISTCFSGFSVFILFVVSLFMSGSVIYLVLYYEKNKNYKFNFVLMLSSNVVSLKKRLKFTYIVIPTLAVVILFFIFVFQSIFSGSLSGKGLYLPSSSEYTSSYDYNTESYNQLKKLRTKQRLPDIADFVDEIWLQSVFPYMVLSSKNEFIVSAGDSVEIPEFITNSDGTITEISTNVGILNDDFIKKVSESFNESSGIEKVIVSQEKMFTTDYSLVGKTQSSWNMWVGVSLIFVFFLVLSTYFVCKRQI